MLERARADMVNIINNSDFGVDCAFTPPVGDTVSVKALFTSHNNSVSTDGIPMNAKNIHISVSESDLLALEYTVRNSSGEVDLKNHIVQFADSTGTTKNFVIKETIPDETLGLIVCILGLYYGN